MTQQEIARRLDYYLNRPPFDYQQSLVSLSVNLLLDTLKLLISNPIIKGIVASALWLFGYVGKLFSHQEPHVAVQLAVN